ncbi:MAG TPA: DUF4055 domain-containing protein, partial [Candidatus Kryptobacter bacterium]|nr:DUF4055 domain-containing protein [Candidatus Kryptobacter bacterium]
MKFGTTAIHAGQEPDSATGAIMTPIYQTSTYVQSEPAVHKGFDYSRAGNPTRTALEKNLDRKESQMVILGARLLGAQKPGIEAAETALIHRSGEQSILASMASAISTGITQALKTFVRWMGEDDSQVRFDLNREFFHAPLDPAMLTAIVSAWQGGAISAETRFKMLQKGEVYTPDADWAAEEAAIIPPAGAGGDNPALTQAI